MLLPFVVLTQPDIDSNCSSCRTSRTCSAAPVFCHPFQSSSFSAVRQEQVWHSQMSSCCTGGRWRCWSTGSWVLDVVRLVGGTLWASATLEIVLVLECLCNTFSAEVLLWSPEPCRSRCCSDQTIWTSASLPLTFCDSDSPEQIYCYKCGHGTECRGSVVTSTIKCKDWFGNISGSRVISLPWGFGYFLQVWEIPTS